MAEALHGAMALLIAVAGWFYMFYSKAAVRLETVESQKLNRWRVRMRRFGGALMLLLAVCFYAGGKVDESRSPRPWLLLWTAVAVLLLAIIVLALVDLLLTHRLRTGQAQPDEDK